MPEPDAAEMAAHWNHIAWLEAEAGRVADQRPDYAAQLRTLAAEKRANAARESLAHTDVPTRPAPG